jgi:DNA-binding transcriptional MerR regulator
MGRKSINIPIHGTMLRGFITEKFSIEEFAKAIGTTRMTVHTWLTSGKISPKGLSDSVKLLNLTAEDVRLLERIESTILEKKIIELRNLKMVLVDIKKLIEQAGL